MWLAIAKAKKDIPLEDEIIKKNTKITITKGVVSDYVLHNHLGIYELPKEYVKDIKVKVE